MKSLDSALLYLRIVVGGMLLFHNVGKMQNYNEVISTYNNLDNIAAPAWFVIFAFVECITAIMIIIGWQVRFAASLLILGTIIALALYFPHSSIMNLELNGIYVFLYIYIFISGGGLYSLDSAFQSRKARIGI